MPSPEILLSGLADEASDDLAGQLRAHRELGWSAIELRLIDRQFVTFQLPETAFAAAADAIDSAGLTVTGLGSAIGNWSRPITGDFTLDLEELRTAIPRMQRLRTRFIRTMSWKQGDATDASWRHEALRRYRILADLAAEADIVLLHENCAGWAGQSAHHFREFLQELNHPHVGTLFDIGNTVSYGYDPWAFYQGLKPLIRYVHIKDCRWNPDGGHSSAYTLPGEGDAKVREILGDLLASGFRGIISIEPHIALIIHQGAEAGDTPERFNAYLNYGRRAEEIVAALTNPP